MPRRFVPECPFVHDESSVWLENSLSFVVPNKEIDAAAAAAADHHHDDHPREKRLPRNLSFVSLHLADIDSQSTNDNGPDVCIQQL